MSVREVFLITAGGDGRGQGIAFGHSAAADQAIKLMWSGTVESAISEDDHLAHIHAEISDPDSESWCDDCGQGVAFSFEDGFLQVQRLTPALTSAGYTIERGWCDDMSLAPRHKPFLGWWPKCHPDDRQKTTVACDDPFISWTDVSDTIDPDEDGQPTHWRPITPPNGGE